MLLVCTACCIASRDDAQPVFCYDSVPCIMLVCVVVSRYVLCRAGVRMRVYYCVSSCHVACWRVTLPCFVMCYVMI